MKFLILNGPNINFLGIREPGIYGKSTYNDLIRTITDYAVTRGVDVTFYQSNCEGALVDAIQKAYYDKVDGIVFNPAAYTHTSVAILDAVKAVSIPTVEVHLSDVNSRDEFRKVSYIRQASIAMFAGHGFASYTMAIDCLIDHINGSK
ncbi:MAG: 3-dehydroquinate dehydratase [Clostridia bacterium]|nr:3-dehydroquinate dehydratase [Clostridia bacterium]MBQ8566553.1 3-dehydroquinate dehydratase [Clostridia bacterium]